MHPVTVNSRLRVAILFVTVSAVLGGCGTIDWNTFPWRSGETTGTSAGAPPAQPADPPASTPQGANARTARVAAPPTARPAPLVPPEGPVEIKLVGLSLTETEAVLGRPSEEKERPPAKVWQYRATDCAVDVYFYLDVARNAFYALHYDVAGVRAVPAAATNDVADRCLQRVYNARRQPR